MIVSSLLAGLLVFFNPAEAAQKFRTTPILIRTGHNNEGVYFTNETSSYPPLGLDALTASFLGEERVSQELGAFMQDYDRTMSCVNTLCPKLIRYHTKYTKTDGDRFKTQFVASTGSDASQPDIAGYFAPTPGYCGSRGDAMIELYSDSLDSYSYLKAAAIVDKDPSFIELSLYRCTRSLGYMYYVGDKFPVTGSNPDYIDSSVPQVSETYHPLQPFYIFQSKTSQKTSFGAQARTINKITLNYDSSPYRVEDVTQLRVFMYNNLISTARTKCGQTTYLYEVYNNVTDVTRISPKTKINTDDIVLGLAGLSLKAASTKCGFTSEALEYQNKADPTYFVIAASDDAQYASSADWIITQRLGFMKKGGYILRATT